jgi:hypothetical protein
VTGDPPRVPHLPGAPDRHTVDVPDSVYETIMELASRYPGEIPGLIRVLLDCIVEDDRVEAGGSVPAISEGRVHMQIIRFLPSIVEGWRRGRAEVRL